MGSELHVEHRQGDSFEIRIRQHVVRVDQPVEDGGGDSGPTPTELFVGSLAACVAHYTRRYLVRHELPTDGLGVWASFDMAKRPARVGAVLLHIDVPPGVPAANYEALLAVASHCTVHNSLDDPPDVDFELGSRAVETRRSA